MDTYARKPFDCRTLKQDVTSNGGLLWILHFSEYVCVLSDDDGSLNDHACIYLVYEKDSYIQQF